MSDLQKTTVALKRRCLRCNVEVDSETPIGKCAVCDDLYVPVTVDPVVGTVIGGKYRVIELIAAGGMGKVYNAVHEHLNTEVALKMLLDTGMTIDRLKRFQHEAKLASSIVHPNIVRIQDFGVDPAPFLVMEKVAGEPLSSAVERTRGLEPDLALRIGIAICDAMDAAHRAGLLHRDLKPGNVMIDLSSGAVKLIDFGLAKAFVDDVKLTRTGETVGSPPYMSPEQCRGDVLDARSDIYSFGCMMYEILTGQPPFRGENIIASIFQHLEDTADTFAQVRPDLKFPKGLETVVNNCLNKSPDARYQSMSALRQDLERVSQRKTVKVIKSLRIKKIGLKPFVLTLVGVLVCASILKFGWPEQPLPVVVDANALAVGDRAATTGTVAVKLQDRKDLNGLTKEQLFALRSKQSDENRSLLQKTYQPSKHGFSHLDEGAPWLSYEGTIFRNENGMSATKGLSVESEPVLNPLLLINALFQDKPEWRKEFIGSDAAAISRFPFCGRPRTLSFTPASQVSEASYDVTDYVETMLELNDWKEYRINNSMRVNLVSLNAWDFGYNFMFVTAEHGSDVTAITKKPIRVCQFIHRSYGRHGVKCNCAHFPKGSVEYYGAPANLTLPCTERVALWKQEPKSASQPPDFTCLLRFELDNSRFTDVEFLQQRLDDVMAREGADSKRLISIYRRLGDATQKKNANKALQYYGKAIAVASLHKNDAEQDLKVWIIPEFLGALSRDSTDGKEIERIAAEQKWSADTTDRLKKAYVGRHSADANLE